jgi:hypothetical protein
MATCPKCKKEIDCLILFSRAEYKYHCTTDDHYSFVDSYTVDGFDQYECPECNSVLFDEEKLDGKRDIGKVVDEFLAP